MRIVHTVVLAAVVGLVGCSGSSGPKLNKGTTRTGGAVATVGKVVVTVSEEIPADRRARIEKVDGPTRLTRAIEAELTKAGRLDPKSTNVLEVLVNQYRLRSGAAVWFLGFKAGGDFLGTKVTVRDGAKVVAEYQTGAGSGGAGGLSQDSRFERLSNAVAQRVVGAL